jgi:hypothetical protein
MVARVPLCSAFGAAEQPPTGCKRAENMLVSSPGKQLRSALNSGPGMSRDRFGHCDIQLRRRHGHDCHLKFRERVFERAAHDQLTKMRQSTPYVWVHPDEER